MKPKFIKLFLASSTVALTTVTLSSCAAQQVVQYGVYSPVLSNAPTDGDTEVTDRQKTFKNFYFNNFGYSSTSTLYAKATDTNNYSSFSNTYSAASWLGVMFPLVNYINYLSNLYYLGFNSNNNNWKKEIINVSSASDIENQFIYSLANTTSKGKSSLKFGVVGVALNFTTSTTSQNGGSNGTTSNNSIYPAKDSKLKFKKSDSTLTFESTSTFQLAVKLGYWNSSSNNPTQNLATVDQIKSEVSRVGSWDSSYVMTDSMYLVSNYSNVKLNLTYQTSKVKEADSSQSTTIDGLSEDGKEFTWTENLAKASLTPTFSFSGSSSSSSNGGSSGTSNTPALTTLDNSSVNTAVVSIASLLSSSSFNLENINKEKEKYLHSLTLSKEVPSSFASIFNGSTTTN
ncbi:hypothetical protein D8X55_04170 [Malacoplasma penetrans]|uniref:hypothetical protein n=1 Tax=Malacoplasma penetrans TaxID=28227 RepID=UPI0010130274|nr:hypothetical protein [Malacoplasma penetrans]RXY96287.1 hypothetical protein D8X55_04170 [Malacoplasma penetrans]